MVSFHEAFIGKRFVCCALTIVYSIYNTVGRSIASIYDLGGIFTSLPYYIYNIYIFKYISIMVYMNWKYRVSTRKCVCTQYNIYMYTLYAIYWLEKVLTIHN